MRFNFLGHLSVYNFVVLKLLAVNVSIYFYLGIGVGGSCVVCPVYISEFAETSIRGMLGTCFQLFLTIGILIVFCAGAITEWVGLSVLCLAIPVLNLVALFFLPESPTWLLKNVRN